MDSTLGRFGYHARRGPTVQPKDLGGIYGRSTTLRHRISKGGSGGQVSRRATSGRFASGSFNNGACARTAGLQCRQDDGRHLVLPFGLVLNYLNFLYPARIDLAFLQTPLQYRKKTLPFLLDLSSGLNSVPAAKPQEERSHARYDHCHDHCNPDIPAPGSAGRGVFRAAMHIMMVHPLDGDARDHCIVVIGKLIVGCHGSTLFVPVRIFRGNPSRLVGKEVFRKQLYVG